LHKKKKDTGAIEELMGSYSISFAFEEAKGLHTIYPVGKGKEVATGLEHWLPSPSFLLAG